MERVRADEHPLSSATPGRASFSSRTESRNRNHASSSRTPSASLVRSAVRSVLDEATPSTIVSDDRSEGGSFVDGDLVTLNQTRSPTLASLQTQRLPPIPDEQDRKRFIVSSGELATEWSNF